MPRRAYRTLALTATCLSLILGSATAAWAQSTDDAAMMHDDTAMMEPAAAPTMEPGDPALMDPGSGPMMQDPEPMMTDQPSN
jgi:hypothetical protein